MRTSHPLAPNSAIYSDTIWFEAVDPRSQNLNTEVGLVIRDETLARAVEAAIETDMAPGNSWDAARDDPDQYVSFLKRSKAGLYQLLPMKPLL